MRIKDWRTRRIIAVVLGYWTILALLLGVSCYRRGKAAVAAYQASHPEHGDFLVEINSGWNGWVILVLALIPPVALIGYRLAVRKRVGPRPAV